MKFAIVACLILNPFVSAIYLPNVHDEKLSPEINYQKLPASMVDAEILDSKRFVKDVEAIELKARDETLQIPYKLFDEIASQYLKLQEEFEKNNLSLDEYICGRYNKSLNDAVWANVQLHKMWKSFWLFMVQNNADPQDIFCIQDSKN